MAAEIWQIGYPDLPTVLSCAADSSRTTHGAPEAIESCQLFAAILCAALDGYQKEYLLRNVRYTPSQEKLVELVSGAFSAKEEKKIRGTGYCVESLEAALWCFFNTETFEQAVLRAANLGEDGVRAHFDMRSLAYFSWGQCRDVGSVNLREFRQIVRYIRRGEICFPFRGAVAKLASQTHAFNAPATTSENRGIK